MIQTILSKASDQLKTLVENPMFEAQLLLSFVMNCDRSYFYTHQDESLSSVQIERLNDLVKRRCNNEPIAYLKGCANFWTLTLAVNDTLIPRPETELLVEMILSLAGDEAFYMADLGTGSGAIALSIANERRDARIVATDICTKALSVAKKNSHQLGIDNIHFYQGAWCQALPQMTFDFIVSNPPYLSEADWAVYGDGLKFEPYQALVSGESGLEAIDSIVSTAGKFLKKNGYLLIEHGFMQGETVRERFKAAGFQAVRTLKDLAGHERVTLGSTI